MPASLRPLLGTLLPAVGLLAVCGCVATQRDILDLSQQNDTIQLQVQGLKKVMTDIQANQADLNARLDDMRRDMGVLTESLKDSQDSTSRLSAKMDDLGAALGMKVSSLQKGIDATQQSLAAAEARHADAARQAAAEEAKLKADVDVKAKAAAAAEAAAEPSQIFQDARRQYDKGAYDLAAQGFTLYLTQFPKGESADLAGYYLGQSLYSQKKWEEAARAYAGVLDKFPTSDVTAASRLRYAQSLLRLGGHDEEAMRYLESIPQDFRLSPEAIKARDILRSLGKKKRKKAPAQ